MAVRRISPIVAETKAPPRYVFRSLRVHPAVWLQIEALAARETMSVNGLINALLEVALHTGETVEGQEALHQACTQWRTRYEYKMTAKREARS